MSTVPVSEALRVDDVIVTAGDTRLLDGVTLSVAAGKVLAVVGANGAGKTTLLDAISGVVPCVAGIVAIEDDVRPVRPGRLRAGVGRVFQGSPLPETLTVAEVAEVVTSTSEQADLLLDRFGLTPHASSFVAELSTGMRRILDLAVATASEPKVLLLDEPASGLAQSEIEQLAELLLRWRDRTGAAVVLVEHDAWLVRAVADEVLVLDAGKAIARGTPKQVLDRARSRSLPRVRSVEDPGFHAALTSIARGAVPAPPLAKRSMSTWSLLRLGLREFAAGLASVLLLGVLNRVLKVELGVSLGVVAVILASYNLAAPIALAVGHRSDVRPIFGRRRTPYIIGGAIVAGGAVALAPHVAGQLAHGITPGAVIGSLALFIAMGIGMYGAGTVFFALLADLAPERERGHAAAIAYFMLMAGIFAGVALTGSVVEDDASNLGTLFALAGFLVVALTTLAVWGQERRIPPREAISGSDRHVTFRRAIGSIAAMRQARLFFLFMVVATIFLFLQQAVLEPYGGDVLGLGIRATSAFNAMMTLGLLIGMGIAGRPWAEQFGHKRIARVGLIGSVAAFALLAFGAATRSSPASWLSILGVGLFSGVFNVAILALMMGMADRRRTALFMGAWTVAHAIADGTAVAGGGLVYEVARWVTGGDATGYAAVFALEAAGLALCLPLLRRIDPTRFRAEAEASAEEALDVPIEIPALSMPSATPLPEAAVANVADELAGATTAARASGSSRPRSAATKRRTRTGAEP